MATLNGMIGRSHSKLDEELSLNISYVMDEEISKQLLDVGSGEISFQSSSKITEESPTQLSLKLKKSEAWVCL